MVAARAAFLASGAYGRVSDHVNQVCKLELIRLRDGATPVTVLDVGCGEGYYTRRLASALSGGVEAVTAGVDVAKAAVAFAASRHRAGWYAAASAFELPVPPASVDLVLSVFGPVSVAEFARVLRPQGAVVAVHPGPAHLFALRQLVYERPRHHVVKDPLRSGAEEFTRSATISIAYPLMVAEVPLARALLAMTPYRWHAPRDVDERVAAAGGLETSVDVVISCYRKRPSYDARPPGRLEGHGPGEAGPRACERAVDSST